MKTPRQTPQNRMSALIWPPTSAAVLAARRGPRGPAKRQLCSNQLISDGPSTQCLRLVFQKSIKRIVVGSRNLHYWIPESLSSRSLHSIQTPVPNRMNSQRDLASSLCDLGTEDCSSRHVAASGIWGGSFLWVSLQRAVLYSV